MNSAPILTTFDVADFCGRGPLHVGGLTRVNVLVGANGVGKTELMYAIYERPGGPSEGSRPADLFEFRHDDVAELESSVAEIEHCRGGILLMLEDFAAGVHHLRIYPLVRTIAELAREHDVQVFAATHSLDVMHAIARLHSENPDLAADVSVHRLTVGQKDTYDLTAQDVDLFSATSMDPRGWE